MAKLAVFIQIWKLTEVCCGLLRTHVGCYMESIHSTSILLDFLPTSAYLTMWALNVTTAYCARCRITSLSLSDFAAAVTVLLQAIPAVLKGLKVQSAAWLQGEKTMRDRLNVAMINSEFLSVLGTQYHCQRLHSVTWSEDTSVLTLITVSESQKQKALEFITVVFCSGVYHRPGSN